MVSVGCDIAIWVPRTGVQLSGTSAPNQRGSRHPVGEIHHRCANFRIFSEVHSAKLGVWVAVWSYWS